MAQPSSPELARLVAEIEEQPASIARAIEGQRDSIADLAERLRRAPPRAVVLVARGSSDNAAVYGRYLFEVCNRALTSLAAPSTVTLYGSGPSLAGALVIGVSQSGQGEDVVAYLREARRHGAVTVAVVNDAASPLAASAEWVLDCLAGPEVSVPATKTVTAQMAVLAALSRALAGDDLPGGGTLAAVPEAVARALALRPEAKALAPVLAEAPAGAVIGRGFAFPVALEIALKLKETSYTRAEPFSAADFLHGPVALVDPAYAALLVDVGGRTSEPARQTAAEVGRRGGRAALLRVGPDAVPTDGVPTLALEAPLAEPYAPIVALVLGQLLALEVAAARGLDPARPRGLRKVTSTR